MIVLAADTSLPLLSVALLSDLDLVAAVAMEGRGSRNEKLLPAIDWLLAENGIDRREIDLLAVTRGPGSFTGVRIGLATMQGLGLALGRSVCAMSTHEAIAHGTFGRVQVVDDAGRGEFFVSVYEQGIEIAAPALLREPADEVGKRIEVGSFLSRGNVALSCGRRAVEIERGGEGARYRDVTPIYVRMAEAEARLRQQDA